MVDKLHNGVDGPTPTPMFGASIQNVHVHAYSYFHKAEELLRVQVVVVLGHTIPIPIPMNVGVGNLHEAAAAAAPERRSDAMTTKTELEGADKHVVLNTSTEAVDIQNRTIGSLISRY